MHPIRKLQQNVSPKAVILALDTSVWEWNRGPALDFDVHVDKMANFHVKTQLTHRAQIATKRPIRELDVKLDVVWPNNPRLGVGAYGPVRLDDERLHFELANAAHQSGKQYLVRTDPRSNVNVDWIVDREHLFSKRRQRVCRCPHCGDAIGSNLAERIDLDNDPVWVSDADRAVEDSELSRLTENVDTDTQCRRGYIGCNHFGCGRRYGCGRHSSSRHAAGQSGKSIIREYNNSLGRTAE
jgi:hypothetical protein